MSFLLKCNVFPPFYQASRRGLPYNLHNVTRRSIALGCKMKQESEPNETTTTPPKRCNLALLREYMKFFERGYSAPLITRDRMKESIEEAKNIGDLSPINVLLVLKLCGDAALNIKPAKRSTYLHQFWKFFIASDVPLDVSHYNTFLKSRMENEEEVDFEEFLREMESKKVMPNRVTYQHFLTYYCYHGELGKATNVLETMKANNVPLNEQIFNALIMGHSVADDIAGANDIFRIMKEKNLKVGSETYYMYVSGLARSGNISKLNQVLEECSSNNIIFSLDMKFDIIYHLIISGHKDDALKMLEGSRSVNDSSPRHEFVLEHRLLHKMHTDALTDVLPAFSGDQRKMLWPAYCYILQNEGVSALYKFCLLCQEKGIVSSRKQIKDLLHDYHATDNNDLEELARHFNLAGTKSAYFFLPFLNKNLSEGDTFHLALTLQVMNDKGIYPGSFFIKKFVTDKSKLNPEDLRHLMAWMKKNGTSRVPVMKSFLRSAMEKGDLYLTEGILKQVYSPNETSDMVDNLIVALLGGHIPCVAAFLKAWYFKMALRNIQNGVPESKHETVSLTEKQSRNYANFILTILKESKTGYPYDILQKLVNTEVPLPADVVASIKESWHDEQTITLIDNLQTPQVTLADIRNSHIFGLRYLNERGQEEEEEGEEEEGEEGQRRRKYSATETEKKVFEFEYLIKSGNLTEATERLHTDHELNDYYCYTLLIKKLLQCGEEEKVRDLLERLGLDGNELKSTKGTRHLYLESEMLKRKMFIPFKNLCTKRFLTLNKNSFNSLLPIMKSLDGSELLKALDVTGSKITSSRLWLLRSFKANELDLAFNILKERLYSPHIQTLWYEVLPFLYGTKRFDAIEKILENPILGGRLPFDFFETLFKEDWPALQPQMVPGNFDFVRFVEGFPDLEQKCRIVEKLLEFGIVKEHQNKNTLYQILLELYGSENVNPEKCLELWYKQQEENLEPTKMFLIILADILKRNDMPVEFHVPEIQPPSFKDVETTFPTFPSYLNRQLTSLKNDETRQSRLSRLLRLVRIDMLHHRHLVILRKEWSGNKYARELSEDVMKQREMRNALFEGSLLSYLVENGITTKQSFQENVNRSFLASYIAKKPLNKTMSDVLLWFYWTYVKPCPELVNMVKPESVSSLLRETATVHYLSSTDFPRRRRKMFREFLKKNKLLVDMKDFGKMGWEEAYTGPPSSSPEEEEQEEEEEEEEEEEQEEEQELFEKNRFDKDMDFFGNTDKTMEKTGAPELDPRT